MDARTPDSRPRTSRGGNSIFVHRGYQPLYLLVMALGHLRMEQHRGFLGGLQDPRVAVGSEGDAVGALDAAVAKRLVALAGSALEAHLAIESETISRQSVTPEGQEGIKAFLEKRKPRFD